MAKLVSKTYASSLLEAGIELNMEKQFQEELKYIKEVVESQEDILSILGLPKVSNSEKKDFLSTILEKELSQEILNFLFILIDKRRVKYLIDIIQDYNNLFNEHEGIVDVLAITAVPMEEISKERLKTVLKAKLDKKIQLSYQVDKSIIGGVMLKIDEKIMDATLASQLKSMEFTIKNVSL